jgi:hypothetical protein
MDTDPLPTSTEGNKIQVTAEQIKLLRHENNIESQQAILDSIFTDQRREQLIAHASKDSHGRPVKYLRRMPLEKALLILENGQGNALDYYPNLETPIDEEVFIYFLREYGIRDHIDKDEFRGTRDATINELLHKAFPDPQLDQDIEYLAKNLTYRNTLNFISKNMATNSIAAAHAGAYTQRFSPLLSASVGGIITESLRAGSVYVEMIIPDEEIILHENGIATEGEKEVLLRQIKTEYISRIYVSTQKLQQEQIYDKSSSLATIAEQEEYPSDIVNKWRWDQRTAEYLPIALGKNYKTREDVDRETNV